MFLFSVPLAAEGLAAAAVILSILHPDKRLWPPPREHTWKGTLMWLLFILSALGIGALGIADWGTLALAPWIRLGIGIPLGCTGHALALWAMATLGIAQTFGDEGALVIRGPYRFSRNPQYLGFILVLLGWALLAGSTLTLTAALVGVIPLLLVPFAEEPWLMERLGPPYAAYKQTVPRFIPLRQRPRDADHE